MTETAVCGWDIGGAHLKLVRLDQSSRVIEARQVACPLWRGLEHLRGALSGVRGNGSDGNAVHAVTMTGELCDNFSSRGEGVREILALVMQELGQENTQIYAGPHGFRTIEQALTLDPQWIASANWHAMAELVALTFDEAILIDVGSTTTDIVPIVSAAPANRGMDDATRLSHDELIYTGVVRTPLMALCEYAPFDGRWQRVAAEHFATTADIYRILGELPEGADLYDTADGAAKTITASARRVCRMLGRDLCDDDEALRELAKYFAYRQFDIVQRALQGVLSVSGRHGETVVAAGAGAFLAEKLARFNGARCVDFASLFNAAPEQRAALSTCAPAAALAKLAWSLR